MYLYSLRRTYDVPKTFNILRLLYIFNNLKEKGTFLAKLKKKKVVQIRVICHYEVGAVDIKTLRNRKRNYVLIEKSFTGKL